MASSLPSMETNGQPDTSGENLSGKSHHKMSARNRFLFFLTAWLIVLMPFLFWWNTWFGRHLSNNQMTAYLQDTKHPRHIQHALVQLGDRIARHDSNATQWYPALIQLSTNNVEEVRSTDAWVMGQDTAVASFHETLLKMLHDPSVMVRGNAALSLVRFGDASGCEQIVALLQPAKIVAPFGGYVIDVDRVGTAIHSGGLIAKFSYGQENTMELRSPISGRVRTISVATGTVVPAGTEIAAIDPNDDQVWEALRALYLIGKAEDLTEIQRYEREVPEISDRVRQQAALTEKAIRERASKP